MASDATTHREVYLELYKQSCNASSCKNCAQAGTIFELPQDQAAMHLTTLTGLFGSHRCYDQVAIGQIFGAHLQTRKRTYCVQS